MDHPGRGNHTRLSEKRKVLSGFPVCRHGLSSGCLSDNQLSGRGLLIEILDIRYGYKVSLITIGILVNYQISRRAGT